MNHAERMKEIKERVEAATDGPWEFEDWKGDRGERYMVIYINDPFQHIIPSALFQAGRDNPDNHVSKMDDYLFIAHARADIPYLVARVEELEAANKAMRDAFAEWYSVPAFKETQYSFDCPEWEAFVAAMNDSNSAAWDGKKEAGR